MQALGTQALGVLAIRRARVGMTLSVAAVENMRCCRFVFFCNRAKARTRSEAGESILVPSLHPFSSHFVVFSFEGFEHELSKARKLEGETKSCVCVGGDKKFSFSVDVERPPSRKGSDAVAVEKQSRLFRSLTDLLNFDADLKHQTPM